MLKKLCQASLVLLMMFSLAGCKTEKEPEEEIVKVEPYSKGCVDGNHFESSWMNIQADFPDKYVMATEEEIAKAQSTGSEMLYDEKTQENIDEATKEGIMTYEMMITAVTGNPNCSVAVEKLPFENITEKQYLEATRDNLFASMTDELRISARGAMPKVEIAGQEFTCLRISMSMNGVRLSSDIYAHVKDGYIIIINLTYNKDTEDIKDELIESFKPLK